MRKGLSIFAFLPFPIRPLPLWLILCIAQLALFNSSLRAQQPSEPGHDSDSARYWQQQVNYRIDVSLNTTEGTLDGFANIEYINHSPDTLTFIWFHLWPNAYRNDETAFSEQLLVNGRTDFYFSNKDRKGYINRLDFREDGIIAETQDHPQYIDIVKIMLPQPLPPGGRCAITTPFHLQLPFDFIGEGYIGKACQITNWYPKPAVYDHKGWHPFPYLAQGGSYNEYGNMEVRITVPDGYTVAATGELFNIPSADSLTNAGPTPGTKTLRYRQDNIQDFAWFAAKDLTTHHDTLQLPSGKIIDVYAYYKDPSVPVWKNSLRDLKEAVRFRSSMIGEYPFSVIKVIEAPMGSKEETAYPTLIAIAPQHITSTLRQAINHETGRLWFGTLIGTDQRTDPWMDQGFATYYDHRQPPAAPQTQQSLAPATRSSQPSPHDHHRPPATAPQKAPTIFRQPKSLPAWIQRKMPEDPERLQINTLAAQKKDQPIATAAPDLTLQNDRLMPTFKAGAWMQQLEDSLGKPLFDSCMRQYFRLWQFRHPGPEDFRSVIETTVHRPIDPLFAAHRPLDRLFAALGEKGPIPPVYPHRIIRPTFLFSERNTDKISYINIGPGLGYNEYDQLMIGAVIHNLDMPPNKFQFLLAPLFATNSRQWNGLGALSYSWYPDRDFRRITLSLSGSRFSTLSGADSLGNKLFGGFYKIVPSLRLTLNEPEPRSTVEKWIEWKTYLIGEKAPGNYVNKATDSFTFYPSSVSPYAFRYLNQLSFNIEDHCALYPYKALLQIEQSSAFYRVNVTGNYFFNYEKGGGMALRFFAAKFGYIGGNNPSVDLSTYEPKLTAVRGDEDYTYSDYFLGRNEFTGLASQQVMMRDGGLKIRTDEFQGLQGRSDNWVTAINLNSSLPPGLLPPGIPLKVFLDIGTYAEAWQDNPPTSHFLYVGGLQLSLFQNILNIYAPLIYSSDFGNQLKTLPDDNTFLKKISFSIDLRDIRSPHSPRTLVDNPFE